MKPKSLLLLLVAGGCGLVAALAVSQHLTRNQDTPVAEARRAVVVALSDQEAGTQLKPEMLKLIEMPAAELPEGTFSTLEEATGQALRFPIFKGELLLAAKLAGDKGLEALTRNLPDGMRAVAVKVADDDPNMSGLISPGNFVDVFWLTGRTDVGASVILLLQRIKVLAVGLRTEADELAGTAKDTRTRDQNNYLLAVSTVQSRRLTAASSSGKIRLVLRGKGDSKVEELNEDRLDTILGLKQPERPAPSTELVGKPETDRWEVEVQSGGQIETKVFNVRDEPGR